MESAAGYQIYCQAPGETGLTHIDTIDTQETYTHQTAGDGDYIYAVATVRNENQEESVSGLSNTVTVTADATAPNAPRNLGLELTSRGIKLAWDEPAYTEPVTYAIYRSGQTQILSVDGMTPLASGLDQTMAIDPTPSPTDHCYVVTAMDKAGNESDPSNSQYLNFDLLPVSTLSVSQTDTDSPVLTWTHADTSGKIQRYFLYLGKDRNGYQVNTVPMADRTFTDYGYTFENRSYFVIAVDTNDVQSMGRSITLPKVSLSLAEDTVIKRGIMNAVTFTLENQSGTALSNMIVTAQLGGRTHQSGSFSLAAGESKAIDVIIGGYEELSDVETLAASLVITPNAGETVTITRTFQAEVSDSLMPLQIKNEAFIRGGAGKVWFTLSNTGAAEAEIVTAESSNTKPSADIRYYLVDEDDNVLYAKSFKQSLGDHIVTLSNGRTVARIPAGQMFTSDPMDLFVPANAPDTVYVRLEIDHIYNSLGQDGQVTMAGTKTRKEISLQDTSYYGEILSMAPEVSKGDQDIVITGRAIDRATEEPLADAALNLFITVNGFERKISVMTEDDGSFTHTFEPLENEAGIFYVNAVHPDLLDRPDQGSFIINKVQVTPSKIQVSIPRNYEQKISLKVVAENGTDLTNLSVAPSGDLPRGVHLDCGSPISFVEGGRTVTLAPVLWADNTAEDASRIEMTVSSDESAGTPWATILVDALYSQSEPALYFTPDHIETGVARDDMVTETITLSNKGLAAMTNVALALTDSQGNEAPDWVRLNTTATIGTLAVGDERNVSISFLPGEDEPQGMQIFYLVVKSDNYPETRIGLYPTISSSGTGNVLFKLSDIYTGTFNAKNELIRGLSGAKIRMQNEATLSDHYAVTDDQGEALFEDLSTGAYKCRISADNHQEYTGRVWVKPGITVAREVFLEYNLVTVEWEVNEITIEDRYEILLSATFETDVPVAVVVADPLSVTLPDMEKGDVYLGEFTLTNHGLVRADGVTVPVPASDDNFQYELLTGIPDSLDAKQRITVPYRVTCLKSLDSDEEDQTGGGCYSYSKCIPISYGCECANGQTTSGYTRHCFFKNGGHCGSDGSGGGEGGSGGASAIYGGGSGGGGSTSPAPAYTPMETSSQKCLAKPSLLEFIWDKFTGTLSKGWQKVKDGITAVGCSVNTTLREYNDQATDLWVKVPNGRIALTRIYRTGTWQWDHESIVHEGTPDHIRSRRIIIDLDYITKDGVVYEQTAHGIYTQGTYVIRRLDDPDPTFTAEESYQSDKYLYKDKHGNFRQYDSNGRLMSYGNRLGTIATLVYDSRDDTRPSGIEDMDGARVFRFTYDSDGHLIRACTDDGREVRYDYAGGNLTKVVDALDQETQYTYDGNGNLIQSVDAAGRATIITYNSSNDPIAVKDAQGNGHTFEYDYDKNKRQYYAAVKTSSGRVREVWANDKGETLRIDINGRTVKTIDQDGRNLIFTDEKGNVTRTDYDEKENLTRIVYPDNTEVNVAYDLRFNKVSRITDPLGRITTFEYDDDGNLVKKVQAQDTALERVLEFTYDTLGRVLTATSAGDADTEETTTAFTYDDSGNLETITDPMGNVTRFPEYDAMGNLLRFSDARDNEWTFAYDANGRLTSATTPENHTTAFEYDGANNRKAVINARLKRFEFEYDDHNNLVKAIDPLSRYTSALYNTDHLPIEVTDPDGRTSAVAYDNEGRVVTATDKAGNVISYTYSEDDTSPAPSSMPVAITYPTFTRHLTYDTMYRVVEETDVLDAGTTRTRSRTFDDAGNLATSTDEAGRTTSYEYDALNRLVKTIAPDNGETLRTYDNRDNLIMLQDPNNGIQYFSYDKNNRLITSAKPMGAVTRYEYGATGNRTAVVDPKGQRIEYTYSSENRLTQTRYFAADNHSTPVQTIDFTYDCLGNLLTWNNGTESAQYTYDDLGRKLTETVNYGSFSLSHAYTYTASGEIKTFTGPNGTPLTYDYDTGGHLAGITIPGVGQTGFSYNSTAWNSPTAMVLPGGARQDYTYDPLMRLDTITASDPGANPVMTRGYTYDPQGNITTKATEHGDYTYTYDTMDRLATAINPTLSDESYTYDNLGNRITDVKVQSPITYNADNQLESYGSTSYDYDANGNMARKTSGSEATSFFYNIEDRLEKVENSSGDTVATYGYDPFGRRLWKQVSGTRTYYHYSNEGLIGEYNAQGDELKAYGYKPGSQWTTDPLFMKTGTDYYWYQNDANGTPQKLIASNGLVVWEGRYDSFGNCQVINNGITNNLRFAGQYYDAETGLHYNLNRYYDPQTGRYLRVDPLGDGLNLYVYCFSNPNGWIDPLGLCAAPNNSTNPIDPMGPAEYKAFCRYISGGEILGGGVLKCFIEGPCINNKQEVWATRTILTGFTAGAPGGWIYFSTTFTDRGNPNSDKYNDPPFLGASSIYSAGYSVGYGKAQTTINRIGSLQSDGLGNQSGFDASADIMWGDTTLNNDIPNNHWVQDCSPDPIRQGK